MPVDPVTRERIGYGTAPTDELAALVRGVLPPGRGRNAPRVRRAEHALAELEKRASPERERTRLMGRLAALDGRDADQERIPLVPVRDLVEVTRAGSGSDQCAALYELLGTYGVVIR